MSFFDKTIKLAHYISPTVYKKMTTQFGDIFFIIFQLDITEITKNGDSLDSDFLIDGCRSLIWELLLGD